MYIFCFCSFAICITFFFKFIGCLNPMIKYDWLAEVSTLMWLVERRCDFSTNRTARSAIRAEIALLWTNQIAGNTIDFKMNIINNGNWIEWSAICNEIKRVITKSHDREAGVQFVITSLISVEYCTTWSWISTLLYSFWNL
jgi:hypothetical protein